MWNIHSNLICVKSSVLIRQIQHRSNRWYRKKRKSTSPLDNIQSDFFRCSVHAISPIRLFLDCFISTTVSSSPPLEMILEKAVSVLKVEDDPDAWKFASEALESLQCFESCFREREVYVRRDDFFPKIKSQSCPGPTFSFSFITHTRVGCILASILIDVEWASCLALLAEKQKIVFLERCYSKLSTIIPFPSTSFSPKGYAKRKNLLEKIWQRFGMWSYYVC